MICQSLLLLAYDNSLYIIAHIIEEVTSCLSLPVPWPGSISTLLGYDTIRKPPFSATDLGSDIYPFPETGVKPGSEEHRPPGWNENWEWREGSRTRSGKH
jgi:hypothetical protein